MSETKAMLAVCKSILFLVGTCLLLLWHEGQCAAEVRDPTQWASVMRAFKDADTECPPPQDAIVFVGSSSISWWRTLQKDFAPLTVINHGFGGSTTEDAIYWIDTVALKYKPKAIVIYEGDNDIALGATAEDVLAGAKKLVSRVHAASPKVRVYFLSIKPSIRRLKMWPEMERANRLVKDFCDQYTKVHFIDVASSMLDKRGQPKLNLFKADQLHMNADGYYIWTSAIKPVLLEYEAEE